MPSQATRPPLAGMPAVWLRDNCPCPLCRDPVSGQRLLHITDIPADIAVTEVVPSAGTVSVVFHPDGHRAVFDQDWLARYGDLARGGEPAQDGLLDPRTEDAKRLWSAADLGGQPPRGSWPRYLADPGYRRACQSSVLREGLLLLSGVPTGPGTVLEVAASLGHVRETNYGRPVRLPGPRAAAFYAAYRAFAERLCRPAAMLTVRLRPGDCAVFDNTRVLPRTGFAPGGRRHLQGCYADLDGVESAVAVAGRARERAGEHATTGAPRRKDQT